MSITRRTRKFTLTTFIFAWMVPKICFRLNIKTCFTFLGLACAFLLIDTTLFAASRRYADTPAYIIDDQAHGTSHPDEDENPIYLYPKKTFVQVMQETMSEDGRKFYLVRSIDVLHKRASAQAPSQPKTTIPELWIESKHIAVISLLPRARGCWPIKYASFRDEVGTEFHMTFSANGSGEFVDSLDVSGPKKIAQVFQQGELIDVHVSNGWQYAFWWDASSSTFSPVNDDSQRATLVLRECS